MDYDKQRIERFFGKKNGLLTKKYFSLKNDILLSGPCHCLQRGRRGLTVALRMDNMGTTLIND